MTNEYFAPKDLHSKDDRWLSTKQRGWYRKQLEGAHCSWNVFIHAGIV